MSIHATGNFATDSDALALLEVPDNIEPGTRVWNDDEGAYFAYTITDDALDANIVAVAGIADARWVKAEFEAGTVGTVVGETTDAVDNADPTNPILLDATASNAGTMSAADKAKLDGLTTVANKAQADSPYAVAAHVALVSAAPDDDALSVVLPSALLHEGRQITVTYGDEGDDPGTVVVTSAAGTISGETDVTLAALYDSVTVVSNGTDWLITARIEA